MSSRLLTITCTLALSAALVAQTPITPPDNKYTPAQDVELGREAANETRQRMPIIRDEVAISYLAELGRRLTEGVPAELRHKEFHYSFEVVNVRDINAFALPGGPMFVHRGMIEASKNEGELTGVMAHELSHVVLRHGTAQASKATKYQFGELAGAVIGAIVGGRTGSVIAQGSSLALGTAFLRFGRDYERQADTLGAQIMARVGYDPKDMANMFKTIEAKTGSSGPEWLSDHPNPGNRYEAIIKESASLRVENPTHDTPAFRNVQSRLKALPKAPTTEEVMRKQPTTTRNEGRPPAPRGTSGTITGRVAPPSNQYREYDENSVFSVSVPENWIERRGSNAVTFAPDGAYGQNLFTHGVEIGTTSNETQNLENATKELIRSLTQTNPNLRQSANPTRATVSGRRALQTTLTNVSDASSQKERIQLTTVAFDDQNLFYVISVAPESEAAAYRPAFQRVLDSLTLFQ